MCPRQESLPTLGGEPGFDVFSMDFGTKKDFPRGKVF
jgi:hypothetical protein